MFIGEYRHSIDIKRRLAIPAKFRKDMGQRAVVTRGLDSCLFLYPEAVWQEVAQRLSTLPTGQSGTRSFVRVMLSGASEVEIDRLGRILVPEYLKTYAELSRRVVLTGVGNRLEIWDEARWEEYRKKAEQSTDTLAEKLGEIGAY